MVENTLQLVPQCNQRFATLAGQCNEHFKFLTTSLNVKIKSRGFALRLLGEAANVAIAKQVIQALYRDTEDNTEISLQDVHLSLQVTKSMMTETTAPQSYRIKTPLKAVKVRGNNQEAYYQRITQNDINFGIGPAGTGKTYLAVACAVQVLQQDLIKRIILVRPAVEAGESLGFLPGDLAEKVDPYLRPLFDALYEMLGVETVDKLIETNLIEVAPLAYMRGRTLNDAFIILDESQNTTVDQMKMFLTRIGFGSKAVITGDVTQVDLTGRKQSGLKHALAILQDIPGISFTHFEAKDVVRHALVQKIIQAYETEPQWM